MHFPSSWLIHQEKTPRSGSKTIILITVSWFLLYIGAYAFLVGLDGIFYNSLIERFSVGRGQVSLFTTITMFAQALTMLRLVYILDKVEYHYFMLIGVPLGAVSTALMAFAPNLGTLYFLALLRGISAGMTCGITITALISNWYRTHRSIVTSLLVAFSTGGNALMSTLMASYIEVHDYQAGFLLTALCYFVLCLPAAILMRNTPAQYGLKAHGEDEANAAEAAEKARAEEAARRTNSSALPLNPPFKVFSPLVIGMLFVNFCTVAVTNVSTHFTGYAMTIGKTEFFGAEMITATLFGAMVSQLLCGFLIDRLGVFKTVIMTQSINILISLLLMLNNGTDWMLLSVSFMFGTMYSTSKVSQSEWFRSVFGRENFAKAIGVMAFIGSSTTAVSVALIGFVYDLTGSYNSIFISVMVLDAFVLIGYSIVAYVFRKKTGRSLVNMRAGQ